jgi:hypothetical protein
MAHLWLRSKVASDCPFFYEVTWIRIDQEQDASCNKWYINTNSTKNHRTARQYLSTVRKFWEVEINTSVRATNPSSCTVTLLLWHLCFLSGEYTVWLTAFLFMKLSVVQLVEKISSVCGLRGFIIEFKRPPKLVPILSPSNPVPSYCIYRHSL